MLEYFSFLKKEKKKIKIDKDHFYNESRIIFKKFNVDYNETGILRCLKLATLLILSSSSPKGGQGFLDFVR